MTDSSDDNSSEGSSPYQSDDNIIIKSFITSLTERGLNFSPGKQDLQSCDFSKYSAYEELKSFRIDDKSGTHLYPRLTEKISGDVLTTIMSRLTENYRNPFIYRNKSLLTDLEIPQQMTIPSTLHLDVFVVEPFRHVGIFTFLSQDELIDIDHCLSYNSYIARAITSSVRSNGFSNFVPVHGVFNFATYSFPMRFKEELRQLEERASAIGMKSSMNLSKMLCNTVIQSFLNLLFDFKEELCATAAMETACRSGNLLLLKKIISVLPQAVNTPSQHGNTPLMIASLGGHYDVVKVLLSHKAHVNAKNNRAETSLILACRKANTHKTLDRKKEKHIAYFGCILASDIHKEVSDITQEQVIYADIVELLLSDGADENVFDADGFSPLILTCIFGDFKATKLLLSRGVNVNTTGIHGSTALMWASVFGHDNIVDRLLQTGADVNTLANLNISALHIASYFGRGKIAEKLLAYGAYVDEVDANDSAPIHYAALFGFPNVARLLISHGAQVFRRGRKGDSPIIPASVSGNISLLELMLSKGADINCQESYNMTPIHWSAMYRHTDAISFLISKGAKIDIRHTDGLTALMLACFDGWDDVVELLLSNGADVNAKSDNNSTPLTLVCRGKSLFHSLADDSDEKIFLCFAGNKIQPQSLEHVLKPIKNMCSVRIQNFMLGYAHLTGARDLLSVLKPLFSGPYSYSQQVMLDDTHHDRVLEMLLCNGAEVNVTNDNGYSALHVACLEGYVSGVRTLLEHEADINLYSLYGETALSLASRTGDIEIVNVLLNYKANINMNENFVDAPLNEASRQGHSNIVELLLNHKADVNVSGSEGDNPLTGASREGHADVVEILLKHKTDPNIRGIWGDTPLIAASREGHSTVVEQLLIHKAEPNAIGNEGDTPLIGACRWGHYATVELLLNHGADVRLRGTDGDTPLIEASREGHTDIVQLLLVNKADINEIGSDGDTPLIEASREGHDKVVDILKKEGADITIINNNGETALTVLEKNQTETTTDKSEPSEIQESIKRTDIPLSKPVDETSCQENRVNEEERDGVKSNKKKSKKKSSKKERRRMKSKGTMQEFKSKIGGKARSILDGLKLYFSS